MGKNPLKRKLTKRDFMNAVFVDFEGAKTGTNTEPDYSDPNCRKFVGMMWMKGLRKKLRPKTIWIM